MRGGGAHRLVRWALLVVAVLGTGTGCRVDTRLDVAVATDGSGTVTVTVELDEDAAARVPELDEQLEVDDLVAAGWEVVGPTEGPGGGATIVASKPFAGAERAAGVLAEVSGADGPFRDLQVERAPTLVNDEWDLTGVVDLTAGLAAFSDPALRASLDGTDVGLTEAQLVDAIGGPIAEAFTFAVAVELPGTVTANTGEVSAGVDGRGGEAVWRPMLGDELAIEATGASVNTASVAWLAVAGVAVLVLVGVLADRERRRRRRNRRRRRSGGEATPVGSVER